MTELSPPLILTLQLDRQTFEVLNQLRQQHFPPERNFLPAHITLFHALPGDQEAAIRQVLQDLCSQTPVLSLVLPGLRLLGKGVAVEVECAELLQLRQQLAQRWHTWLNRQDQQGYRPHVTLQNKVRTDEAQHLYRQMTDRWEPLNGYGQGLLLWYYLRGPWQLAQQFSFTGALTQTTQT